MVKKLDPSAHEPAPGAGGMFDSESAARLADSVKGSAHQIWLAGMGAFAKAQAEGGKVFEALVKEGQNLQRKTQTVAEEKLGEVSSRMTGMASDLQARAGQQWDKLEGIFEERTAKALRKLGVPSAQDVAALSARIDALAAAVAKGTAKGSAKSVRKAGAPLRGAAMKAPPKRPARRAV
ncbi:MAG: phasin family protein [Burkholderiaceae bacterium]